MRTTVTVDDELLRRAKEVAAGSGRTLGAVVEDALRTMLEARAPERRTRVDLPVFGGSGLRPGVDLEDRDALAELLDEEDDATDGEGPPRAAR